MEEHYVIIKEPDDIYMTFVTPDSVKARCITDEIIAFLIDSNSEISLKAILCDGTPVNTGRVGGVLRLTELYLERPIQQLICVLQANELPFRDIFKAIDRETLGPKTFKGTIGNKIEGAIKLKITDFEFVSSNLEKIPKISLNKSEQIKKFV